MNEKTPSIEKLKYLEYHIPVNLESYYKKLSEKKQEQIEDFFSNEGFQNRLFESTQTFEFEFLPILNDTSDQPHPFKRVIILKRGIKDIKKEELKKYIDEAIYNTGRELNASVMSGNEPFTWPDYTWDGGNLVVEGELPKNEILENVKKAKFF